MDGYFLTMMRYVESNPMRAGMVRDHSSYAWSSHPGHGLGDRLLLVDEVPLWASLGKTEEAQRRYWRQWLHAAFIEKELASVRRSETSSRF